LPALIRGKKVTRSKTLLSRIAISLSFSVIVSCGGGGGGGGGSEVGSTNPTPGVMSTDPSTVNFITHLAFAEKVSLVFPEDWNRQGKSFFGEPEILAGFVEPAQGSADQFLENVVLVQVDITAELTGDGISNIQEISTVPVEVAGFPGEETIFDADVEGAEQFDLRFMTIGFEFEGSIYGLLYSAERAEFERNTEIVRYMAANLIVGQILFDGQDQTSDLASPGKPGLASDGSIFLAVSCRESEDFPYPASLIGRIVNDDRTMGPEFEIQAAVDTGNTGCTFTRYNAVFDGVNFLVTYMASVDGARAIVAKRISPQGLILDSLPLVIYRNDFASAFEPDAVFDGDRTLVVWSEDGATSGINGAFVNRDGSVTGSFPIADNLFDTYGDPNTFAYSPHIAYADNQFMVIWSPYFFTDTRQDIGIPIYGQLLDQSGNLLLSEPVLIRADNGDNPRYPQIASDGTNYLVGWIEGLLETNASSAGSFTVYARQINSLGELVGSSALETGIEISPPAFLDGGSNQEIPKDFLDLSFNDGSYLFLWSSLDFNNYTGVYGVRVSQSLQTISETLPVVGLDGDTAGSGLSQAAQPKASYSATDTFTLWPSSSGVVEGWFPYE
jgi:hypothetical protein